VWIHFIDSVDVLFVIQSQRGDGGAKQNTNKTVEQKRTGTETLHIAKHYNIIRHQVKL